MKRRSLLLSAVVTSSIVSLACQWDRGVVEPLGKSQAALLSAVSGRDTIVVNPNANGKGVAGTIQEGINRIAAGGVVLVKAGTYSEALKITKGLTLRAIAEGEGPVVIAPPGTPDIAIQIATAEPVVIQDLTLESGAVNGIRGDGVVNVTVERVTASAVNPALPQARLLAFVNDSTKSGGRAHVALRDNSLDGGVSFKNAPIPAFSQTFGISLTGDISGDVTGNTIRHTGGASIVVTTRPDLGGATILDIVGNDLDESYPLQRAGVLLVQAPGGATGSITATGSVNIIGNMIRNSLGSRLAITAISQMYAPGRIENNRIIGVVRTDTGIVTRNPAAIWLGSLNPNLHAPAISPIIRFNDIERNEQPALRVGPNITSVIDATCNWWGAASGPSGLGSGSGGAVLTEGTAPAPMFVPFATAPIARTGATGCV